MSGSRRSPATTLRIVVLGYIVRGPIGGMCWHHAQYLAGLQRLGHDVWFFEDSEDYESCYDPRTHSLTTDPTYGLDFTADLLARLGLRSRLAYFDAHRDAWLGPAADAALRVSNDADVLINISGVNPVRPWHAGIPLRILIDTDPAFTQLRHVDPAMRARADAHNAFFTFAENFGRPDCTVPLDGYPWTRTRQPVVAELWPVEPGPANGRYTTVMQWESYPPRKYRGVTYGVKSHSFRDYITFPSRVDPELELAMGGAGAPREELTDGGWKVVDSFPPTRDPWAYQSYIRGSKGEFSVAKQAYVTTRSGWFSERSAVYLASGRPVIVQDTGFSEWLPTGGGLMAFKDPDEAAAAIAAVDCSYAAHCRAAREVAVEHFDSRTVLTSLMERGFNQAT